MSAQTVRETHFVISTPTDKRGQRQLGRAAKAHAASVAREKTDRNAPNKGFNVRWKADIQRVKRRRTTARETAEVLGEE